MKRTTEKTPLSAQVKQKIQKTSEEAKVPKPEYDGTNTVVSTGSTLLDLAISGGRFKYGGIPTGILVEIFGPSGSGKTVLLCQLAGNIQRAGGKVMFHDPEARLNKQFAQMFGMDNDNIEYTIPNTIPEVFSSIRKWLPAKNDGQLYGVFADSLAALSTDMEMDDGGDKMGMRRAKEFSEELRKTCRIITQSGALVVCSNQVRQTMDMYGPKYKSPGGEAIGFYSSLRLRCNKAEKIKTKHTIRGKSYERVIGVKTEIEVFKSSVWKPYRTAEVNILFDYGIDDIRANLEFVKSMTGSTVYVVGERRLAQSLNESIHIVEEEGLEKDLREETVQLWNELEAQFTEPRKPKEWW